MTDYAYFPGCSLETSAKEYDTSTRAIFAKMGITLTEVPDWSCCGSSQAHKVNRDMATAIAGRNLVLAQGIGDIVAPCASCFMSLKEASVELEHDESIRTRLGRAGFEYKPGSVNVVSAVEAAFKALKDGKLEGLVKNPLEGLKVASYYGCLLVRPPEIAQFDDPENPTSMDELMAAIGAQPVDWTQKVECCGNAYVLVDKDMVLQMIARILNSAIDFGADVVVAACPLCQSNLVERHALMQQKFGLKRSIPVVYFTQLMGLAMGADNKNLQLGSDVLSLIRKRKIEAQNAIRIAEAEAKAQQEAKEAKKAKAAKAAKAVETASSEKAGE
jgi:heterodisulfide reductase subunit B